MSEWIGGDETAARQVPFWELLPDGAPDPLFALDARVGAVFCGGKIHWARAFDHPLTAGELLAVVEDMEGR